MDAIRQAVFIVAIAMIGALFFCFVALVIFVRLAPWLLSAALLLWLMLEVAGAIDWMPNFP